MINVTNSDSISQASSSSPRCAVLSRKTLPELRSRAHPCALLCTWLHDLGRSWSNRFEERLGAVLGTVQRWLHQFVDHDIGSETESAPLPELIALDLISLTPDPRPFDGNESPAHKRCFSQDSAAVSPRCPRHDNEIAYLLQQ